MDLATLISLISKTNSYERYEIIAKERVINNYAFWQQVTSTHLLPYL